MVFFFRRICSSRPGDGEQRGQSLAALTARGRGLYCFQPQRMAACLTCRPGRCVSKQVGRHDAACQGCPRCVSARRSSLPPGRRARRARFPTCGVIRVAGYSVVWDCDPTPTFSPKEHQKERCGYSRSQRSFITFHGALRNILLSAGFPAMFRMITLKQMFVNSSLQKIFSRRFHS